MQWNVGFTKKAQKQISKLRTDVLAALYFLVENLRSKGTIGGVDWPHYGKLQGKKNENKYHCHIIRGRPTYVCCWEVVDKKVNIIEVYYVGTHENAPY